MADPNEKYYFNGINGVTGEYGLALSQAELLELVRGESNEQLLNELKLKQQTPFPLRPDLDPGDLSQAGWGIIFTEKANPVLQEALSELIELRRQQAGQYFRIFGGDDGYRQGESKNDFLSRHGVGPGLVDPENGVPYYLLLVGGPGEIPYDFQYQLDVQFAVGRIDFSQDWQAYANYARSVVTAETKGVKLPRRASFFGVVNEDDRATQLSHEHLITLLIKTVTGESEKLAKKGEGWQVEAWAGEAASKAQLQTLLSGQQAPALLFTASHGMEFPNGNPSQIPYQGALLCSDWPGPISHRGPIDRNWYFAGEDLSRDTNLLGLISFYFACYGAGTPDLNEFAKQGQTPQPIAPYPFLAQLPVKMLGLPKGGALAVVGHVERAWGYSITWPGVSQSITSFEVTLRQLMKRFPIGFALEAFNLRYAEMATELTMLIDRREQDGFKLSGTWAAHNDARSYVILGDPAVRLPVAQQDATPTERPVIEVKRVETAQPTSPSTSLPAAQSSTSPAVQPSSAAAAFTPEAVTAFGLLWGGATKDSAPGPLQQFMQKLTEFLTQALDDATSLEVATYVSDDMSQIQFKEGRFTSPARLRALTHIKIDGDTQLCVPETEGEVDTDLWAIHMEAVKQAQASRAELVKTAISAGTSLFGLLRPGT